MRTQPARDEAHFRRLCGRGRSGAALFEPAPQRGELALQLGNLSSQRRDGMAVMSGRLFQSASGAAHFLASQPGDFLFQQGGDIGHRSSFPRAKFVTRAATACRCGPVSRRNGHRDRGPPQRTRSAITASSRSWQRTHTFRAAPMRVVGSGCRAARRTASTAQQRRPSGARAYAGLARIFQCAVKRRCLPVGANPTRQLSLQPEAIGAIVEATKRLKPSV